MTGCPPQSALEGFGECRAPERSALLEHVRACGSCRALFLAADPTRVFSLLALRPLPPSTLESVSSQVSGRVREARAGRAFQSWAPRRLAWAAAVLVAAVLGGVLLRPWSAPRPADLARNVLPRTALPGAGVELLSSPGSARVVDLTVGDTQVVMIFDERIGL